jgi:hypothetical protein
MMPAMVQGHERLLRGTDFGLASDRSWPGAACRFVTFDGAPEVHGTTPWA